MRPFVPLLLALLFAPGLEAQPDLRVQILDVGYEAVIDPASTVFEVRVEISNGGTVVSGPFEYAVYLSDDPEPSPDDVVSDEIGSSFGQETYSVARRTFTVGPYGPDAPETLYVLAVVDIDDAVEELNEANNVETRAFQVGIQPPRVVSVDFDVLEGPAYSGDAAAPAEGTFWNEATPPAGTIAGAGGLVFSDGETPSLIEFRTYVGGYVNVFPSSNDLVEDGISIPANKEMVFRGLSPGEPVDLYLYSGAGLSSAFTFGGVTKEATGEDTGAFVEGRSHVVFRGLQANGDGEIIGATASEAPRGFSSSVLTGFQLVENPPPAPFPVTAPGPLAVAAHGEPLIVRWDVPAGSGPGDGVRLRLLCPFQEPFVIAPRTRNDGTRGFIVPEGLGTRGGPADPGGECTVEVQFADGSGLPGESGAFAVQPPDAFVDVTRPRGGDPVVRGEGVEVRWTPAPASSGEVVIGLVCEDGSSYNASGARPDDGSDVIVVPYGFALSTCRVQVRDAVDASVYGRSEAFPVRNSGPASVTLTAPTRSDAVTAGEPFTIRWVSRGVGSSPRMRLLLDGNGLETRRIALTPSNSGEYDWDVPADLPPGDGYRLRISGTVAGGSTVVRDAAFFEVLPAPAAARAGLEAAPTDLTLEAPFPNPAHGRVTVRYGLPEASTVTLALYDGLGRRVATLADGTVEAGWHEAGLDATGLAAGVYLVRLEAAGDVRTATATLAR